MARFVQARNYTKGRIKPLRVVVWHDMEAPEKTTTAEGVANYFAGANAPQASAHVCADSDSVVECVKPGDTAWHAPGANADGYGIELAGYARQSTAEWEDDFSKATIHHAAHWVAPIMHAHGIPARFLTDAELAGGEVKGMTTHAQVTRVFRKSDHTDPGPNFPEAFVASIVHAELAALEPKPAPAPAPHPAPKPAPARPTVRRGMGSKPHPDENVRHAQVRLVAHGFHVPGGADGIFGAYTESMVKEFQRRAFPHNSKAWDGIVGPDTWKALDS